MKQRAAAKVKDSESLWGLTVEVMLCVLAIDGGSSIILMYIEIILFNLLYTNNLSMITFAEGSNPYRRVWKYSMQESRWMNLSFIFSVTM